LKWSEPSFLLILLRHQSLHFCNGKTELFVLSNGNYKKASNQFKKVVSLQALIFEGKKQEKYKIPITIINQNKKYNIMELTTEQKVKQIISQIRPHLQADGGDIRFVALTSDNVVKVELQGACGACPHSRLTLKHGVEATLKKYIPEITSVEDINLPF
jgi:Fe-S cluster biogenesis protein NfuA